MAEKKDDLNEIRGKVEAMLKTIGEQLSDIEVMKDLATSRDVDVSWMNEVDERLAAQGAVIERLQKQFVI